MLHEQFTNTKAPDFTTALALPASHWVTEIAGLGLSGEISHVAFESHRHDCRAF